MNKIAGMDIKKENLHCDWHWSLASGGTDPYVCHKCGADNTIEESVNIRQTKNYMFWRNLKTIHHAVGNLLEMDKDKIDEIADNGHAWAIDNISTSCDDIEEVYHFLQATIEDSSNGEVESGDKV